jgi:hypothetical protein
MAGTLLLALGTALCLNHGRVGFMPLDQSIVFDGAWRLLCGQRPFRDFVVPSGLVPMVMQAAFFKALGVTWFSYCLHAALVNGFFSVASFALLRRMGAARALAFFYAVASAIVFYTPFGVPFMDQHAFFFFLLTVLAAAMVGNASAPWSSAAAFALPSLLVLALLSKQLPSVLAPLVAVLCYLLPGTRRALPGLRPFTAGASTCAIGLALAGRVEGIEGGLVQTYLFTLPRAMGQARVGALLAPGPFLTTLVEVHRAWGMWSVEAVSVAFGLWLALAGRVRGGPKASAVTLSVVGPALYWLSFPSPGRGATAIGMLALAVAPVPALDDCGRALRRGLGPVILAEALLLVCLIHAALTNNEPHNSIPFVFLSLGLLHLAALRALSVRTGSGVKIGLTAFFLFVAVADGSSFERRVNLTRRVHKLNRGRVPVVGPSAGLPSSLDFMRWLTPAPFSLEARDLRHLLDFLKEEGRSFFLLGDTSVLYALTGQPSVGPSVWFHPGLTFPLPGDPALFAYERALVESLDRHRVGFVVLENERTFLGAKLADFPPLEALVRKRACERRQIGPFVIVRLCGSGTPATASAGPDPRRPH